MKNTFFLLIVLIMANSCSKKSNTITQSYDLEYFNHIKFYDSFNIILHESDEFRIEITADEKRIEFISFNITDTILEIKNDKTARWANPHKNEVEIHVYSEPLSFIEAEESGFISTANPITTEEFGLVLKSKVNEAHLELDCGTFYYWNNIPSGGKLTLTGASDVTKIWNHALMNVDAKALATRVALVSNSSKGIIEVSPTEKLEYSIYDIGNIHLHSVPSEIISIEISGEGNLVQF